MAGKKMTRARFEKTAQDARMDKAGAKKAGVSASKWEGSAADNRADNKAVAMINAKAKGGK